MVLSEGRFLGCSDVSLHRLVGLLRQCRYDEIFDCALASTDSLRRGFSQHLRFVAAPGLEAQSLYVSAMLR